MNFQWKGVFPAVTTKFNSDESLDFDLFSVNIQAQLDAGVSGIILGGTLGESGVLTKQEKFELVSEAINVVSGKVPVILNVAEQRTIDAINYVKEAEKLGANGFMLLPPLRYPSDERETVEYIGSIANSTTLPIMIYNNPIDYKTEITLRMFEKLTAFENIQSVKESTRDISNVTRMKNLFGDRYKILSGVDTLAMESLCMGAEGWVAGLVCAFPNETVAIFNLIQEGKIDEARKIYQWFLPLLELDIHPKLVQYIKLAETMVGLGSEHVRSPRLTLIGEERERVSKIIQEGISKRPTLNISQTQTA
jgi:dihydrodipicolinate synthase/N-acetylneuraminate lyase